MAYGLVSRFQRVGVVTGLFCLAAGLSQGCSSLKILDVGTYKQAGTEESTRAAPVVTPTSRQRAAQAARASSMTKATLPGEPPMLLSVPQASLPTSPPVRKTAQPDMSDMPAQQAQVVASPPALVPAQVPVPERKPALPAPVTAAPVIVTPVENPPVGLILPAGMFGQAVASRQPGSGQAGALPTAVVLPVTAVAASKVRLPDIRIYASQTTRTYFATASIDYQRNIGAWEGLLRRYGLPFQVESTPEGIDRLTAGVVILPSAVSLSEREKSALARFRERGGSVLATWLAGVRSETGSWSGFGFMEKTLEANVLGNNAADLDDNYLMPYGDNPVTHGLPAGQRVWVERAPEWYPLRLKGVHEAARLMDWSRTVRSGQPSSAIVFNERKEMSGQLSRVVLLGYPEKIWISSDPKSIDTLATDALNWLLRQPAAYVAAWPYPYDSAMVVAVDAPDAMDTRDMKIAWRVEELGGKASFFVLTEHAAQSQQILQSLKERGHEIAYLGDRFVEFKDQPPARQAERLVAMRTEMKAAGLALPPAAGFRPPLEAYDANTVKLLNEAGMGYMLADAGATDTRLPFVAAAPMLGLPRTVRSLDDALPKGSPSTALKTYLEELDVAARMGGLTVLSTSAHSTLAEADLQRVFQHVKAQRKQQWLAPAAQVAAWWRERERVSVRLDASLVPALMTVRVSGDTALRQPVSILVNLPAEGSSIRLAAAGNAATLPKIARADAWRGALILQDLAPGEYRWHVFFDAGTEGIKR